MREQRLDERHAVGLARQVQQRRAARLLGEVHDLWVRVQQRAERLAVGLGHALGSLGERGCERALGSSSWSSTTETVLPGERVHERAATTRNHSKQIECMIQER